MSIRVPTPRMSRTTSRRSGATTIVRRRGPSPRGNALVLVAAILLLLAIIGTAYIVRTQGAAEVASATQTRSVIDARTDAIAGAIVDEVSQSLFVKPIIDPLVDAGLADPGLTQSVTGVIPVARSDWPRRRPEPTASRYGIDPLDRLTNLLDPGNTNALFGTINGGDGYPDGYNFAPYSVIPWTNWPDNFGVMWGESNPLGNPGFGDSRWLASTEPQRASVLADGSLVPDPFGTTFSHWAHLSWIPTAENGFRVVTDISSIEANTMSGSLASTGTAIQIVPADPTTITVGSSLAALGIPYEQWLPGVIPDRITSASNFRTRANAWFTPAGYYLAVHGPYGSAPNPDPSLMLPNVIRLADPLNTGTILTPGTRPTDAGPTRFLASGLPDESNNTIRNQIERTLADADGDGITDSFWFLAPSSVDRGVRQIVAARIIDNSGLLNLNVATRFQRRNVPASGLNPVPATRETRGHTPADLALVSTLDGALDTPTGFLNSPDNAYPTGFFASSPGLTVAFDPQRWASTQENDPSFLRERGIVASSAGTPNAAALFPEQLRAQTERLRVFKAAMDDGIVRYYQPPVASGLPVPDVSLASGGFFARINPFTSADEVELRMSHGQNQPFILSRLERALNTEGQTYAFLRSGQNREEASEWTGKQLTIPQLLADNRRKITTISAARNETLPPALWTRWWNVENGLLRPIDPNRPMPAFGPPGIDDLPFAYPTLTQLAADLGTVDPPAYTGIAPTQLFTVGAWRPEVIRGVAGDANNDGVVDLRDLDAARRDFFIWNSKQDLREPIDLDRVGADGSGTAVTPVVDLVYGVFGRMGANGLGRSGDGTIDSFDHAFSTIEWTNDFRRRALRALKYEYRIDDDGIASTPPVRTVVSYADRYQVGSNMPGTGYRTLTGTPRARSITGASGDSVDTALKSELVTDAMAASLAANAATSRRGVMGMGPFIGGVPTFFTSQPLLPAFSNAAGTDTIPDQRVIAVDPDPTLPGSTPPSGKQIVFTGIEPHPVIMEAFFAVVWPKTRLGSTWQYLGVSTNPSVISPKPADPYSVPTNYGDGGNESHFVAIVPRDKFLDQYRQAYWAGVAQDWQRQSTAVVAVQVANPFPHPIRLADFELNVFGNIYRFPAYELDANGNTIMGPDTTGDGTPDPLPLMLGPTLEDQPRTAIVFAITDHNQINYKPGDDPSSGVFRRYPLTKGVEFDPFFRARWLDYLDIVEATDLPGANPSLQSAGLSGAAPTAFCPHNSGVTGIEFDETALDIAFPRRRLLGTNRYSTVVFGNEINTTFPIAQTKILDATQVLGTDVAAYRPNQGVTLSRRLWNPETGLEISTVVVDRFDRDASDINQSSADPVSGWNLSMAAAQIVDPAGRFWPPAVDLGHSSNEDQMTPVLNAPPPPPPPAPPPQPWHLKPQQSTAFNGIRINANDYYITWTRSSRLWGKDFAVVYAANGVPVAFDRTFGNNNGKGDGAIMPDERAPRYMFASSKQRPDLPLDGSATSGILFADGQGPFRGRVSGETYRGAAFQGMAGLTPWVQDILYNSVGTAQPYPLPPFLKNPANSNNPATDQGAGDPDLVGTLVAGIALKGNHLLPFTRNFTVSLTPRTAASPDLLTTEPLRVAMKPTNFPTKTVVGTPSGEVNPRQYFGLAFNAAPAGTTTYLADKGMRPPVSSSGLDSEILYTAGSPPGTDFARAIDAMLPMDGAFTPGQRNTDFDTVSEVTGLMIWGPVYGAGGGVKHTLGEILTDRVPGYPVGLVRRYIDIDGDGYSGTEEQNPAWAYLNRLQFDNPTVAFSWFDLNGLAAVPPGQRILHQWGGAAGAVGGYASSLPVGSRLLEAFTLDDRGAAIINGGYRVLPRSADIDGNGTITVNELAQWAEDRRFRLAAGGSGKGTPGMVNVNTAPVEVLRAFPHMSRLVYMDALDLDGDGVNDLFDMVDTDGDGFPDSQRPAPQPGANPLVRVPEAMDLYRSRMLTGWRPDLVYSSRANRGVAPNAQPTVPHYLDRGQIPGDLDNDGFQDTGFYPGMRAERGFESLGEATLLTRTSAAPNGAASDPQWGWDDNQSWSVRFAGMDPFRLSQSAANNAVDYGGGYRQTTANGPYLRPPYDGRISVDSNRRSLLDYTSTGGQVIARELPGMSRTAGDALQQQTLLSSLSNILTTRSDVFTVYFRVRSVRPDPITGRYDGTDPRLIVDDSRYVMCIDRSEVERPSDAPKIVYFQKVPH